MASFFLTDKKEAKFEETNFLKAGALDCEAATSTAPRLTSWREIDQKT